MIHRSGAFGNSAGVDGAFVPSEPTFDQVSGTTPALLRRGPRREGNAIGLSQAFDYPAEDSGVFDRFNLGFDEASQLALALYPNAPMILEVRLRRKERALVVVTNVDWRDSSTYREWFQSEPVPRQAADNTATWVLTCRMGPIGHATELGWLQGTYPHGEVEIEPGRINAWLRLSLAERSRGTLSHLMALEEGWDGYDGLPTLPRVAEHTELFLEQVEEYTTIAPDMVSAPERGRATGVVHRGSGNRGRDRARWHHHDPVRVPLGRAE